MLIPIGAWCRTAYQVGEFLQRHNATRISLPFDWTITSFSALNNILGEDFDPQTVLSRDDARVSPFGSVIDTGTDLIFHHDLLPKFVSRFIDPTFPKDGPLPEGILESEELEKGKARFVHTYGNLVDAVSHAISEGERIGFVRWNRSGLPEPGFPRVFEGETVDSLWHVLSEFSQSPDVCVLQVVTIPDSEPEISDEKRIVSYERSKHGARVEIRERPGFDGDGTHDFKGDTRSWTLMLERFVDDFAIALR